MALAASMNTGQRRLLFGVNVLVSAVLAVLLLIAAVWLGKRFRGEVDLTAAAVNSLSPRTTKLLGGLKEDVRITAFYSVLSKYDEKAIKWRDKVRDLLVLYDQAGGARVNTRIVEPMEEAGPLAELAVRLRDKASFKDESKPHDEAIQKLRPLLERIKKLAEDELAQLKALADADQRLYRVAALRITAFGLERAASEAARLEVLFQEAMQAEIPRVGAAIEQARPTLPAMRDWLQGAFDWMTGDARSLPDLASGAREHFGTAGDRYPAVLAELDALIQQVQNLNRVKLESIEQQLRNCTTSPIIAIETAGDARVLSIDEVWPYRTDAATNPSPDGDPREFNGEAVISSAVLQLTQRERTAVVFARFGGAAIVKAPEAPCNKLGKLLEEGNFLVDEWDVMVDAAPPTVAGAARTVLVVLPPPPPPEDPRQQPPPPVTPEILKRVSDVLETSGGLVLAEGRRRSYELGSYLRETWGVNVQHTYTATGFAPTGVAGKWTLGAAPPMCFALRTPPLNFTDHEISRPIGSQPGLFFGVAPLEIVGPATQPAADESQRVTVTTLAEVSASEDWWAVDDFGRIERELRSGGADGGTSPGPNDVLTPFPIAVAATRGAARVVVVGSTGFMLDVIAQSLGRALLGRDRLVEYLQFPANTDFFVNALYWVTGDADRIAVGPRKADVPRLDKLREGAVADFWRWFLIGVWPGMVLLAGVGVWLVRRR